MRLKNLGFRRFYTDEVENEWDAMRARRTVATIAGISSLSGLVKNINSKTQFHNFLTNDSDNISSDAYHFGLFSITYIDHILCTTSFLSNHLAKTSAVSL